LGSNYGKRGHAQQSGNLDPLLKLLDGRNNVVESYTWCKGMVNIGFIIFLKYLKIGEEQNMLHNNVTRNKMCTISCKHKGVIDLIC
jgi:hypothetical protein